MSCADDLGISLHTSMVNTRVIASYSAKYRDEFGEETTVIHNDGRSLRMSLRGVEFESAFIDDWEPTIDLDNQQMLEYPLHRNELHSYSLDFMIPVPVGIGDRIVPGNLRVLLVLGAPKLNGAVDREDLLLELLIEERSFTSCGKHGWFEDELLEIHRALPESTFIKSCFNCAYSDYSPAGYGLFGCMACFRNNKEEYLSLKGKVAFFKLMGKIVEFV